MTNYDPPVLRRPLEALLEPLGELVCLVGDLALTQPAPPCSFRLVGGSGEWVDADTGRWTTVRDADFVVSVQSHPRIGGVLTQARLWATSQTVLTYACGTLSLLHDGTVGIFLPRQPWPPAQ